MDLRQLSLVRNNSSMKMPYKAENCRALSYKQYFSTPRFLDICPWVFKGTLMQIWKSANTFVFKQALQSSDQKLLFSKILI